MPIHWRREAADDLDRIRATIANANPSVAHAVVGRVPHSIERLEMFPESGRIGTIEGTRELVVPGLPYIVVHRLSQQHVEIIAVFHGAEDRG